MFLHVGVWAHTIFTIILPLIKWILYAYFIWSICSLYGNLYYWESIHEIFIYASVLMLFCYNEFRKKTLLAWQYGQNERHFTHFFCPLRNSQFKLYWKLMKAAFRRISWLRNDIYICLIWFSLSRMRMNRMRGQQNSLICVWVIPNVSFIYLLSIRFNNVDRRENKEVIILGVIMMVRVWMMTTQARTCLMSHLSIPFNRLLLIAELLP